MGWSSLGTITLSSDWQLLNQPVVGGESFRFRQFWSTVTKPSGKVLVGQFYNQQPPEIYGIRAFYATTDYKIIELPVPADFKAAGMITRYFGLKLIGRYASFSPGWQISVDQFI